MEQLPDCTELWLALHVTIAFLSALNVALATWLAHRRMTADNREKEDRE